MNNENQLPCKYRWNHTISLPNGNSASAAGKMKEKGTTKSRKNKSLHGVQAFHRRQHLKPINCVSITNRRNSAHNIRSTNVKIIHKKASCMNSSMIYFNIMLYSVDLYLFVQELL